MKTFVKISSFRFTVLLVVLGGVGYFLSRQEDLWITLRSVDSEYVFTMTVADALFLIVNAMILKTLLEFFQVNLSLKESLSISSLAGVGNFLTSLRGGTIGKAIYLKKKYTFPYMTFIAATSAVTYINFNLAALIGMIAILLLGYGFHPLLTVFLSFFIASNLLLCFLLFSSGKLDACQGKLFERLSDITKGLDHIRRKRTLAIKISFLLLLNFSLSTAELALSYAALSINISLVEVILIDAISVFSEIIKILPANLGVYEGSIALSSQILGVGFREGLFAAGLVRLVSISVMLMFGLIFSLSILAGKTDPEVRAQATVKE